MKKMISAALLALLMQAGAVKAQSVSYTVVTDDPHALAPLKVYFMPLVADMFKPSMSMGFGVGGSYAVSDKIGANMWFMRPYTKNMDGAYHTNVAFIPVHNVDETKLKRSKFLDLGGFLVLTDKDKKKNVKVVLSSFSSGNYTYSSYLMVPGTVRKITKARGGIFQYNTSVSTAEYGDQFVLQAQNDTGGVVKFDTYGITYPDGSKPEYDGHLDWAINMSSTSIYAGLCRQSITNLTIDPEGYKKKGHNTDVELYADVMFAPVIITNDIKYKGVTYDVTNNGENSFQKNHLGWRVGMEGTFFRKNLAFSSKGEIGVRPGIKGQGFYLDWSISFPVLYLMEGHKKDTAPKTSE
jgi:hypothetical protein